MALSSKISCLMTKPTKWHVRPAKTQISLGIRPVWSESSLSAWRNHGPLATHWAHSEDWSDCTDAQADLSLRWAHIYFVGFVMSWLKSFCWWKTLDLLFKRQSKTNCASSEESDQPWHQLSLHCTLFAKPWLLQVDCEDTYQTGWMSRCHFVCFVMLRLI